MEETEAEELEFPIENTQWGKSSKTKKYEDDDFNVTVMVQISCQI